MASVTIRTRRGMAEPKPITEKPKSSNGALVDIRLPHMDGMDLLRPLNKTHRDMVVAMVIGYASVDSAVRSS